VRQDQSKSAKLLALKSAIQKGIDSGASDSNIPNIMKQVEDRMKKDGRL
jgi:antitoxin ParD1/3/4